uniref:Putative secreted protein n=1 Tax=Rhipicephalus microplus TaxID=6941 RepID=A0A6M2DB73_RHIMP
MQITLFSLKQAAAAAATIVSLAAAVIGRNPMTLLSGRFCCDWSKLHDITVRKVKTADCTRRQSMLYLSVEALRRYP